MPSPDWSVHIPEGSDPDVLDLTVEGSLPTRWRTHWSGPSRPQLRDVDGRWLTTAELEDRTRQVAGRLIGTGLEPGDRVVLSAATSAAQVVAYVALLRAGLIVVPVNTDYREPEVARIVRSAMPRAAIIEDPAHRGWVTRASDHPVLVTGLEVGLPDHDADIDQAAAQDTALLIYTSGTTGEPKGVGLTHGNLLAGARAVELAWRWEQEDHLLLTLPLFHLHGLGVGINGTLSAGARATLRPGFAVDDVAARLEDREHTVFFGVPAMYQRLAESGRLDVLRGLRLTVSGSAPLPAELAERIEAGAGELPLERYGMSETVMLTSNPYHGVRRAGSVGWPLPGVQLRLDDDGEVEVKGPNVIDGYWNHPQATAEAFTADGWFRTGDIGRRDDDGRLALIGRNKELIISGGYNVYPREVEDVLLAHPAIREVAVVGRPSERWGEEVMAFVVAAEPVEADAVIDFAKDRLVGYKAPKQVRFLDALPVNALGKVVRSELT